MDKRTKRIKMILPVPLPQQALDHFAEQIPSGLRRRDLAIDFVGCRAGATWLDSDYEATLADAFVLDAGARAEEEGYDVVCSFSTSNVRPDTHELLSGKEEVVFAALQRAALAAIDEDGADVIVIGSTTMYQSHAYLASVLPCPVINPVLAAYKVCENLLDLDLAHSKLAYPSPEAVCECLFERITPIFRNC
jgi:nucleotide-binding universal stress UspA family protein